MTEQETLIIHSPYEKTASFNVFSGSWAEKLGYESHQGPPESWGKTELYCPRCGARGLWRSLSLEESNAVICAGCGDRFDIHNTTPMINSVGFYARAHLERLGKLKLAEADIEIRAGAGTKKDPHHWLPAIAGRQTQTRLYYRWPDDPPTWERGPVRLDCRGLSWRKLEQEVNPCQSQTEK